MDTDTDRLLTEMGHVLFLDIVGYSRLSLEKQVYVIRELRVLVRATAEFLRCEERGELLRLDTGDGMALVFFGDLQSPIRCACEIAEALGLPPHLPVRIGLHSGPVIRTRDINSLENVSGNGINFAQRVMDCGDVSHILLSKSYADLLRQMDHWPADLHDLGEVQVKHGVQLSLVSFHRDRHGNPLTPRRLSSPIAPSPPTNLPFWRLDQFVGRTSTLALVHDLLQSDVPVALVGISGLGKTQLALHYAHLRLTEYPGGVFWINAADSAHLISDYAILGRSFFGLPDALPSEICIARLRDCLARLTAPALLIFDNVTEDTDLSHLPSSPYCRLLLTTQVKYHLPPSFETVELPKLDADAALALLGIQEGSEEERAAARQIATAVGRLPLVLALISHHRLRLRISFAEYLRRFLNSAGRPDEYQVRRVLERASEKFTAVTGHNGRIYETIERSYQSLNPLAQTALVVAGILAPSRISRRLLQQALILTAEPGTETDWDEALADLTDASLISEEGLLSDDDILSESEATPSADSRSHGEATIRLHELVRLFARVQSPDETLCRYLAHLSSLLTDRLQTANDRLDWRDVRFDMAHVLSTVVECRERGLPQELCSLLIALGHHLTLNRDFRGAKPHLQEGLILAERLHGFIHSSRAQILRLLSEGEHVEDINDIGSRALKNARTALRIARKAYPADAIELCEYYGFVGYILKDKRQYSRARPFYEKLRHLHMDVHGGQHPKVAVCLNDLGMFYFEQENYAEAERYLRQALALEDGIRSLEHSTARFTPYLLHNLGRVLAPQSRFEEALECHQSALDLDTATHGLSHPRIATGHFYSATVFDALGRNEEAWTHYQQALSLYTTLFGDDNFRCVTVREKLALLERADPIVSDE